MQKNALWTFETLAGLCDLMPGASSQNLGKRLSFMTYEASAQLSSSPTAQDLIDYFFENQNYSVSADPTPNPERLLLSAVLHNRSGAALSIGIILRALCAKFSVDIRFIGFPDHAILKCCLADQSCFIDLRQDGKALSHAEMLERIQRQPTKANQVSFEPLDEDSVVQTYLRRLLADCKSINDNERSLIILDYMAQMNPQNPSVLKDRSLAYFKLNRRGEALRDLDRYFAFTPSDQHHPELIALYQSLRDPHAP